MQITIDTALELTAQEKSLLSALISNGTTPAIITEPAPTPTPAKTLPAKAPAPKPEPEPEPEPEEDLIGGEPTVQDAVDAATLLVNGGKQAVVKAALKTIGADRVSNIPQSKVQAFIDALNS